MYINKYEEKLSSAIGFLKLNIVFACNVKGLAIFVLFFFFFFLIIFILVADFESTAKILFYKFFIIRYPGSVDPTFFIGHTKKSLSC